MQAQTGPIGAARFLDRMFGPPARPGQLRPESRAAPLLRTPAMLPGTWTDTEDDDEGQEDEDDGDDDDDVDSDNSGDGEEDFTEIGLAVVSAVASSNEEELVHGLECIICTEPYLTKMAALPCGHVFHIECALTWITQMNRKNCPHCRKAANRYTEIYIDKSSRPSDPSTASSSTDSADLTSLAADLTTARHKITVLESNLRAADKRIEDEKQVCAARIATTTAVEAERDRLRDDLDNAREKYKQDLLGRDRRHDVIVRQERKAKEAAERLVQEKDKEIAGLKADIEKSNQKAQQASEALMNERRRRHKVDCDYQASLRQTLLLQQKVELLTRELQDQHQQLASSQAAVSSPPLVNLTHSSPLPASQHPRPPPFKQEQHRSRPPALRTPFLSSSSTAAAASAASRAAPSVKRPGATSAQALSLVTDDDEHDDTGASRWHAKRRKTDPESFATADDALDNAFEEQESANVARSAIPLPSSSPIVDRRLKHKLTGFKKGLPMQTRLMFGKK